MSFDTRLTIATTVVAAAVAILAAATLGFDIGHDSRGDRIVSLERELKSYQDAENLNMPETIRILVNTNKLIEKNISEINSYYNWKAEEKKLKSEITKTLIEIENKTDLLEKEVKKSSKLKSNLEKSQENLRLLSPVSEEFWLERNETKNFSGFEKTLGVQLISASNVIIGFDNSTKILSVGDHIKFNTKESNCKLILSEIDIFNLPRALFTNVCAEIKDPFKN